MPEGPARIDSQEVIKDFRARWVDFDGTCRNALLAVDSDIKRTTSWLGNEQLTRLKHEIRKREEACTLALNAYNRAISTPASLGKASFMDEKRDLEKAKRLLEDARRRMDAARSWSQALQQKAEKLAGPVRALGILLSQRTPLALARLDRMVDRLDEYFRPSSGDAS